MRPSRRCDPPRAGNCSRGQAVAAQLLKILVLKILDFRNSKCGLFRQTAPVGAGAGFVPRVSEINPKTHRAVFNIDDSVNHVIYLNRVADHEFQVDVLHQGISVEGGAPQWARGGSR